MKRIAIGIGIAEVGIEAINIITDPRLTPGQKVLKGVIEVAALWVEYKLGSYAISVGTLGGPFGVAAGVVAAMAVAVTVDYGKNSLESALGLR